MAKSGPKSGPKNGHFWDPKMSKIDEIWQFLLATPWKNEKGVQKNGHFGDHFLDPFLEFLENSGKSSTFANQILVILKRPKKGDQKVVKKWSKTGDSKNDSFGDFGIFENPLCRERSFFQFLSFLFRFFLCFWTSKKHDFWKIGFFWSKNMIFCIKNYFFGWGPWALGPWAQCRGGPGGLPAPPG